MGITDLLRLLRVLQKKIEFLRFLESGIVSGEAETVSQKLALLIEKLEVISRRSIAIGHFKN
ncbi:MAG: hypothetical protein QHH75_09380 [Bacillota bacterium]|jgi:hypothetical protein|nr:hypothetical protein [Bacillota bacterium]